MASVFLIVSGISAEWEANVPAGVAGKYLSEEEKVAGRSAKGQSGISEPGGPYLNNTETVPGVFTGTHWNQAAAKQRSDVPAGVVTSPRGSVLRSSAGFASGSVLGDALQILAVSTTRADALGKAALLSDGEKPWHDGGQSVSVFELVGEYAAVSPTPEKDRDATLHPVHNAPETAKQTADRIAADAKAAKAQAKADADAAEAAADAKEAADKAKAKAGKK